LTYTASSQEVNLSELDGVRYLHLGSLWVQGAMTMSDPLNLELDYIQRMMAWLLFVEPDSVRERHAMQLGLGAAAITKFCVKKLEMACTAVELNERVVDVCRAWFKLPPEGPRFRVVVADATQEIERDVWQGTVDALAVDLYDGEASAPVISTPEFYAACRNLLTKDGIMTVNLFGRSENFDRSLANICTAFGSATVWQFKPTREGNTVVLACRTVRRLAHNALAARAATIEARWGLPATKWVRVLKPVDR
jgi:spermidine synthase